MENITFWKYTWNITFANYANWRIALIFWNEDWKISNLTVNFVEVSLEKNYWFLNANLPYAKEVKNKLLELWVIEETPGFYPSWYLLYEKVKFLKGEERVIEQNDWKIWSHKTKKTSEFWSTYYTKQEIKDLYGWKVQKVSELIADAKFLINN